MVSLVDSGRSNLSCIFLLQTSAYDWMSRFVLAGVMVIFGIFERSFPTSPSSWLTKRHLRESGSDSGMEPTNDRNHDIIAFSSFRAHSSSPSIMTYTFAK